MCWLSGGRKVNSLDCTYTQRVEVNGRTLVESLSERRARSTQRGKRATRLTSPAQDRKLVVKVKRNRFSPVSRLSREWARACSISISERTAARRAVMAGLPARRPAQRIPLSPSHKRGVGSSGVLITSVGVQNGIVFCGQRKSDFASMLPMVE